VINHLSIGMRDLARTRRLDDAVPEPLGYKCLNEDARSCAYGREPVDFWISLTNLRSRPIRHRACMSAAMTGRSEVLRVQGHGK
jgi:hypothetical protein